MGQELIVSIFLLVMEEAVYMIFVSNGPKIINNFKFDLTVFR